MNIPLKGSYSILWRCTGAGNIRVGRLGLFRFIPGYYGYFGNARVNLPARINRHLRAGKSVHWHVDFISVNPGFVPEDALVFIDNAVDECRLARMAVDECSAEVPFPGFGSSDCRQGCTAHLVYWKNKDLYLNYLNCLKQNQINFDHHPVN